MKKILGNLILVLIGIIIFTACNKDYVSILQDLRTDEEIADEISLTSLEPQVMVKGSGEREDYQRIVVEKIVKSNECREFVVGVVEFYHESELVFTVDFGSGICDGLATVTWVEGDGMVTTMEVEADKIFKKKRKREDCERSRCFEFVLPVTFTMPDNSMITLETKEDWAEIRAWHEVNLEVKERGTVQFPVDITLKNGETRILTSKEDFEAVKEFCEDGSNN